MLFRSHEYDVNSSGYGRGGVTAPHSGVAIPHYTQEYDVNSSGYGRSGKAAASSLSKVVHSVDDLRDYTDVSSSGYGGINNTTTSSPSKILIPRYANKIVASSSGYGRTSGTSSPRSPVQPGKLSILNSQSPRIASARSSTPVSEDSSGSKKNSSSVYSESDRTNDPGQVEEGDGSSLESSRSVGSRTMKDSRLPTRGSSSTPKGYLASTISKSVPVPVNNNSGGVSSEGIKVSTSPGARGSSDRSSTLTKNKITPPTTGGWKR